MKIDTEEKYFNIPQNRFVSKYPPSFIPKDGKVFIGIDWAAESKDCTVKGFRDSDGVMHIQEVEYN